MSIKIPDDPNKRLALALRGWEVLARDDQKEPDGDWRTWLIRSGRGAGKTRTGAEWIKSRVEQGARRIALVAQTSADARDVMVEGNSGLLSVYPPSLAPTYEPSKRRVTWQNGARATLFSGDKPDQLRGPEHDTVWCDELAKFQYPQDTLDNVQMGLRVDNNIKPRCIVTTTPRPIKAIKQLIKDPNTHSTVTATFRNKFLDKGTLTYLKNKYEGTRTGRQELYGEVLDEVEGAIVNLEMIDETRLNQVDELDRIVVAIDPAVTSGEDSDETGIVVAGRKKVDGRMHGYIIADRSCRKSPAGWAKRAIDLYHYLGADCIIAEVNNGGDMIKHTIHTIDNNLPVKTVTATRGKHVRFEPVGGLYEQGRIHHVGAFPTLEDQLCGFTAEGYEGGDSPDHADAAVWALTELMVKSGATMDDVLDAMRAA